MSQAVLFDLDGVLIDSESCYTVFWAAIDREYPTGIPDFARVIKGTNLARILQHWEGEELRREITRRIHDFEATMEYTYYPGAPELLAALREAGMALALFTSSDSVKMECLYRQHPELRSAFDVTVTGSMVTQSKPHPQGYLMAAGALGVNPGCCAVVEDSMQGLQAGRSAGCRVVGISTTNPRLMLTPLADLVVDTVSDLTVEIFRGL